MNKQPDNIDISKLDKPAVLAALYNNAQAQGMGFLHFRPAAMTYAEAAEVIKECGSDLYFDYLHGRVMKVDLNGDTLRTGLYDRDNGLGAAANALKELLEAATP